MCAPSFVVIVGMGILVSSAAGKSQAWRRILAANRFFREWDESLLARAGEEWHRRPPADIVCSPEPPDRRLSMAEWRRFREPLRVTLTRTLSIALVAGGIVALTRGNLQRWPAFSLLMLWPAIGGHWVDLFFLNVLRPHVPVRRATQLIARLVVWFAGGIILAAGVQLTARVLF